MTPAAEGGRARAAPRIEPYRGYANADRAFVRGRVLADPAAAPGDPGHSAWTNLRNTLRRLRSSQVPHARVAVRFQGAATESVADRDGHFRTFLLLDRPPPADRLWHDVELELLDPRPRGLPAVAAGAVLVPPANARFGVISDIDDTVIRSDVARLARMAAKVLFGNAHTRLPFPGVAAFFRALAAGGAGPVRPVFYVSSGPWNLYDVLVHFLELQRIPLGPVELRDWGPLHREVRESRHAEHKRSVIRRLFHAYPALPFLLIGDSSQEDPEIYRDLIHAFPHRVPAVYIRNIRRDPLRVAAIRELADEVETAGSALVLADDTRAAARHAAEHGWIDPAALEEIEADRRVDQPGGRASDRGRTVVVEP